MKRLLFLNCTIHPSKGSVLILTMTHRDKTEKILVVDDYQPLLDSITLALGQTHYEIHAASTYEQALTVLSQNLFELILTDIDLGDHSGIDLIPSVKSIREEVDVPPFIFMTGNQHHLNRKEIQPYLILVKPFSTETLINAIESQFLHHQTT